MSYLSQWAEYFDIEWNTEAATIHLRSIWFYEWCVWPGLGFAWNGEAKTDMHQGFERQVMGVWSQRLCFKVGGTGPFARKFTKRGLDLDFDIKRNMGEGRHHWNIRMWKIPPNEGNTDALEEYKTVWPRVMYREHIVVLNDKSLYRTDVPTVAHEFGHILFAPDEYNKGTPYYADNASVMNHGRLVRGRSLYLLERYLEACTRWRTGDTTVTFAIGRR